MQCWWWHFCGGNAAHPVALKTLPHCHCFSGSVLSKEKKTIKQSTSGSVFVGGILTPCVQQPGTSKNAMPPSMLQQKKEKQSTCSIGGCATVCVGALQPHMEGKTINLCIGGSCVFGHDASGMPVGEWREKQLWHLVVFVLWWLFDATWKEKRNIQPALLVVVLLWCMVMQQVPHAT